jgi:hypothetical protein
MTQRRRQKVLTVTISPELSAAITARGGNKSLLVEDSIRAFMGLGPTPVVHSGRPKKETAGSPGGKEMKMKYNRLQTEGDFVICSVEQDGETRYVPLVSDDALHDIRNYTWKELARTEADAVSLAREWTQDRKDMDAQETI